MRNCTVTKLKGVVDNDNLLKLGEMIVKFDVAETVSDDFLAIRVNNTKQCVATVKNGTFMNSDYSASEGTEKTIPAATDVILRVSNTGAEVRITEKYTLGVYYATFGYFHKGIHFNLTEDTHFGYDTINNMGVGFRGLEDMTGELNKLKGSFTYADFVNCFSLGGTINGDFTVANDFNCNSELVGGVFANSFIDKSKAFIKQVNMQQNVICDDIANFPVCPQLNQMYLNGSKLYGDVANFPQLPLLQLLNISKQRNIVGTLSSLYVANVMTQLAIANTGITGSLEDFAQACVGRGRTSGTLKIDLGETAITYQGAPATNTNWYWTITFSGSGYTITSGW